MIVLVESSTITWVSTTTTTTSPESKLWPWPRPRLENKAKFLLGIGDEVDDVVDLIETWKTIEYVIVEEETLSLTRVWSRIWISKGRLDWKGTPQRRGFVDYTPLESFDQPRKVGEHPIYRRYHEALNSK